MTLASFALALMLLAEPSDQSLKTMTLEQLANIEVTTVTKEAKAASKTSAAIFVITGDDIRRSGATSIPEVLRLAPGVEVSQIDSGHWSVGIRGFQGQFSSAVLVLIDGRSVYTPLFAGVYWDVQNTLLEDVERIEIIRGPGGTIWGANAFQGVINIITRSSKDTHGTLATVGGGSIDQATAAVRFGGGNGSTFDYRAYGQMFSRGPEKHPDDRQFDDWRMQQFGFRTDWNRSSRDSLTVQGDTYHGDVGEMVSTASFSPAAEVDLQGNDLVSGGNIRAQWQHDMSRAGKLQVQTFYDRTNRTAPHYKETRDTVDLDVLHHFALPARQNISWGFGVRWSPGDFTPLIPTIDFQPGKKTERIYSAFVQDEIPLLHDKLSLLLGNKWERNIYTGVEVQPSARLEWSLSEHHTFWAAVTQAVRTPSRLDRDFQLKAYLTTVGVPFYLEIDGSPAFNSERLAGTAAGYRSLITSKFHIDISAYHNRYHYLSSRGDSAPLSIQTTPITYVLLFKIPYANGVGGTTDGFEIAPEWNATAWWQWRGSYSSLHMNLKNEPGNSDTSQMALYEGSSPHHQASLQSHMDLAKKFELDVAWRYVSALPAQAVAAYQTADVRWGWSLSKAVELSLNGTNLLQPHHAEFGRSPQATVESVRSVYAKLTWKR